MLILKLFSIFNVRQEEILCCSDNAAVCGLETMQIHTNAISKMSEMIKT